METIGQGVLGQGNTNAYSKWIKIDNINGNDIKEIQLTAKSFYSAAVIIMNNGNVYGAGHNDGRLGKGKNKSKFVAIENYYNSKQIEMGDLTTYFINSKNELYACGYSGYFNMNENIIVDNAKKIASNVKQVKIRGAEVVYLTENNKIYYTKYGDTPIQINIDINENNNVNLVSVKYFISNSELYLINLETLNTNLSKYNVISYNNSYGEYEFTQNKNMSIYMTDNPNIYIEASPNICKIGIKSNYNLRKVFENVAFVQGKGNNISIVDRNGKIYESIKANDNKNIIGAKKIIASASNKYVIKKDGTLWAKGNMMAGMWGEYVVKNDYIQITKDGINNFTNIKDIYTSTTGCAVVFKTSDNKIYWAGSTSYIMLPQIYGEYNTIGNGSITYYPHEVNSEIIGLIKDKIKDVAFCQINKGGISGACTLILTEDGKLYTMSNNRNMSGNSSYADITNGDFTELTIKEGTTVKQVITEDGLSLALLSNGEIYGWGYNTYGILGPSYEVGGIYPTPVKLEGLPANIRYMSLGNGFAIFASKSGEVYGIGKNDYGQLGTGDSVGRTEFVRCTKLEE